MRLAISLSALFLSLPVLAATPEPAPCADCDLDRLIKTCHELENNEQIRPFETKVFCKGDKTYWESESVQTININTKFNVANELSMKGDRYHVPEKAFNGNGNPSQGSCNVYREMLITVPTIQNTFHTCAELDQFAALGRAEYCRRVIDQRLDEDPIPGKPTGTTLNTCDTRVDVAALMGADFEPVRLQTSDGEIYSGLKVSAVKNNTGFVAKNNIAIGDVFLNVNERVTDSFERLKESVALAKLNQKPLDVLLWQKRTGNFINVKNSI